MSVINLRNAVVDDISEILPLLDQLGYPVTENILKTRFNRFKKCSDNDVVVAIIDNLIVGFIAWSTTPLFVLDKIRFHIEALVVNENYRSKGIGKKLIQFVEEIAHKSGPNIVDLKSSVKRAKDGSHEFYRKIGYRNEGSTKTLYLKKEV
ncbi:MAG: GNAT family N-acetyltransferase [Janthinobacterium lividum]